MNRDHLAAQELRSRRINQGLSPEQLGGVVGVSGHTIRRIEREGVIPTPRIQFALAHHFQIQPTDLWSPRHRTVSP